MILCVPVIGRAGGVAHFLPEAGGGDSGCIIMANGRRELAGLGRH